jgi:hypothetical protein
MPMEKIEQLITILREAVKTIHKKSAERRDAMFLELENFAEDMDDKKKANAIRQMRNGEKKTQVYRRIKEGGITRLQIPTSWPMGKAYNESLDFYSLEDPKSIDQTDDNQWREANCPKEMKS